MTNNLRPTKVLIVEDETVLQDVYKIILEASGYEVATACNGVEGLQQLPTFKPDVILLDLFMPVMDGKEFLRNFNAVNYPDAKIIVYTNLSDSGVEQELLGLGAHKFVLKSTMAPEDLVGLIKACSDE